MAQISGVCSFHTSIVRVQRTGSTNDDLKEAARNGAPEGLVFVADYQTAGRGRFHRTWLAPPRSSLLVSLLFRPEEYIDASQTPWIAILCALAMTDAIKEYTGVVTLVKWPNDIVWQDGKKLCGILAEGTYYGKRPAWVVVGLGLNVNLNPAIDFRGLGEPVPSFHTGEEQLPEDTATSLSQILGRNTSHLREPILQSFLRNVDIRYRRLRRRGLSQLRDETNSMLAGMGQLITVHGDTGSDIKSGKVAGVDASCALLLCQESGDIERVYGGEISLYQSISQ